MFHSFVFGVKLELVYCYCYECSIIINKSVKQTYDLSQLAIISTMAKHICKEIAKAHEIDLRDTFSSIDVRGENYAGKVGGGSGGEKSKVASGGDGEGGRQVVLGEGKELKVVVANMRGGGKVKEEGGAVATVGSEGEGCGGPKFIEKAGDNAGRKRGQYVCYICTDTLK